MVYTLDEDGMAHVRFTVKDYRPVTLFDFLDLIKTIRENSSGLVIHFDLEGAGPNLMDHFVSLTKLVTDVVEYTKHDGLLRKVEIIKAGFIFRLLYKPISLLLPKEIRDLIVFL